MFILKRAYVPPAKGDGFRVLVDRRWPCNVFKKDAAIDLWLKEIAPSLALDAWYGRDPAKWEEFLKRYWQELVEKEDLVRELEAQERRSVVTLVYRAKDTAHSAALALKEYLDARAANRRRAA